MQNVNSENLDQICNLPMQSSKAFVNVLHFAAICPGGNKAGHLNLIM